MLEEICVIFTNPLLDATIQDGGMSKSYLSELKMVDFIYFILFSLFYFLFLFWT